MLFIPSSFILFITKETVMMAWPRELVVCLGNHQ